LLILALVFAASCDKAQEIPGLLFSNGAAENRPRVVLSSPVPGSSAVAPDTRIFIEFNMPMDHEATQNAFTITGSVPLTGTFRWEGLRMYYDLDAPLQPGESHVMRLSSSARSRDGFTLDVDHIVHFIVGSRIDAPAVTAASPANNSQAVDANTVIRLVFSRDMQCASVESAFSISPSASGDFTWDSPASFTYRPHQPLQFAVTYSVTISTGAKDTEGIPLASVYTLTFQVGNDFEGPTVTALYEIGNPSPLVDGIAGVYKDSDFTAYFDEAMDFSSTQNNFSLIRLADDSSVAGSFQWNSLFTRLTFVPASPLEPENEYRLEISDGAQDTAGNALSPACRVRFRVDNSAGALNSNYMTLALAEKTSPGGAQTLSTDPDVMTTITVAGSGTAPGALMTVRLEFSHSLDLSSVPESVYIRKLIGPVGTTEQIIAMSFASTGGLTNNVLIIDFSGIGANEYELELTGGRVGIRSAANGGESGTWMNGDLAIYFRVTE